MDNALFLLIIVLPIWSVGCVGIGFRMGRKTAGQAVAPLVKPKNEPQIQEDPYHEPMHGTPQKRIPIGDKE